MALYSYEAINAQGQSSRGAANEIDLEMRLKRIGLDLISAKESTRRISFGGRKIKRADLITFFFNLEQFIHAGVPLLDCLSDLRDSMDDPKFREIIANMVESIQAGKKLSQAMAQHPETFDPIFINLTYVGEESGRLGEIFKELSESLKWQDELASQTRNMMIYPAFVGSVVLAITFFLMIYLVPQLVGFIKGMGQEIPIQTRILLATSAFFVDYWYIILMFPAALFGLLKLALFYYPGLQYHIDNLKLHIWPIGAILRKIILARFANTFAMMYGSGISILECITNSRNLANNRVITKSLDKIIREIESGQNLTQSFMSTGIFPPLVIRMLKVGEATGKLDTALRNVSYFYDRDVRDSIKRLQVIIEPTITIILGLLLGLVMLSVLSQIYDLISKVKF